MGTSGEKVRISDEAERIQSVSYSHIRFIYSGRLKRKQAKHLPGAPPLQL